MAKAISGIYIIVNTKNGKVYVGQTQDIHERWRKHQNDLRLNKHRNRHLQSAWNKYGAKNFEFQTLERCSIEQLNEREQHHINIYMAKGNCYNLAICAEAPARGLIPSKEKRRKLSEALKGRKHNPHSEKTRRKISESLKLNMTNERRQQLSKSRKGKVSSEETRRKISESHKTRPPVSEETRLKLSEAAKQYAATEEGLRKKATMKDRHHTEETRRKMSEAARNRRKKVLDEPADLEE